MKIEINSVRDELILDGVKINLGVLTALVTSDPAKFYRFVRDGDAVHVEQFHGGDIEKLIFREQEKT